jgi:hypothetical protein
MCVIIEAVVVVVAVVVAVVVEGITMGQGITKVAIIGTTGCLGLFTMARTALLHQKKKIPGCSIYILYMTI